METVVFVPLAHSVENDEISSNAQVRAEACLREARKLASRKTYNVVLAFGAGAIPGQGDKTLAEYTEEYFTKNRVRLPMLVNRDDWKVFGTLEELRWVVEHASTVYHDPTFVIVSQRRHIRRVRVIRWLFFRDVTMYFVVSRQTEEVPLWHEFFGYAKLLLVRLGLAKIAEWIRRFTARYTHW